MRRYMPTLLRPYASAPSAYAALIAAAQNYWDCQEASGNLVDAPGTADLGAVGSPGYRATGPTAWLPYAVDTDHTNHFNAASPAGRVAIPFSIAAWIKLDAAPSAFHTILCRRSNLNYEWQFRLIATDHLSLLTTNGSVNAVTSLVSDTNWHFVGVACDGSNVSFYLDGNLEVISSARSITNQNVPLVLGTADATVVPLLGLLAGVGIWSSELSEADFDILYAGP